MDFLPLFHNLNDRNVLVVGGGEVALRKVRLVHQAGARITVVAKDFCPDLVELANEAAFIEKPGPNLITAAYDQAQMETLTPIVLVIAATNDRELNHQVSADAQALNILSNVVDDPDYSTVIFPSIVDRYRGEGGVNTAFLTFGFKVFKKIGVGITTNYEFGNLNHITTRFLEDVELATRIESNSSLSGINNVYSLLFREKISKQLTFHATYILSQEFNLGSNNTQTLSTYSVTNQYGGDVEEIDLASMNLEKTEITVPKSQTIGLGLGVETKWFVGAEFQQKDGGGLDNKLFSLENVDFQKGSRFSLGGFYIPKYDSFTSYFSTIVYRAGLRIEDTGLNIQGQAIKEVGFNFGFGIPFQGFSNLNLGFEIGKRGTTNSGLIEENFFSVRLGMSWSDLWFVKNKYN